MSHDLTSSRLSTLQAYLRKLLNRGEISDCDHKHLRPTFAPFGRAHGLPKTHKTLLSFVETPRKFIIAEISIRKLGSSSVLIIILNYLINTIYWPNDQIISTDEDPSLRIESSAIINLRGVSTKLNKYIVFTMQTYKKLT